MKAILGIVVVLAVLVVIYMFAPQIFPWNMTRDYKLPENYLAYNSGAYKFSFAYPNEYEALEYTQERVALGHSTTEGFDAVAEIDVALSAAGVTYTNYKDFLYERARLTCASDGQFESISCTTVQNEQPFEAATGVEGVIFYLEEVHTNLVDNSITTSVEGPFFAFDMSHGAPNDQFRALIIHPPVEVTPESVNADLLRAVANSVGIDR